MKRPFPISKLLLSISAVCCLLILAIQGVSARNLQLEELWRAGGSNDDLMFGVITRVLADDEGSVYLLDRQLAQVPVIARDGTHLRTLGRAGEGPGEARRPVDMTFLPDGRLGIVKPHPGSIVTLQPDGTPSSTIFTQAPEAGNGHGHSFSGLHAAACRGGNLVLDCSKGMPGPGKQKSDLYLAAHDSEGRELCRYFLKTLSMDFTNCHMSEAADDRPRDGRWTVGPDGRVYIASERNSYLVRVFEPDGTLLRTIERDYRSLKRNADETAVIRQYFEDYAAELPGGCGYDFEPTRQDIETLHVTDAGNLWVRTSRSGYEQPPGVIMTLDEFDGEGRYLGQVLLPGGFDADRDLLFMPGGDLLVVVVGGREARLAQRGSPLPPGPERAIEAMTVICFSID
ncbi:MAG: hypothetical protein GY835_25515 [bacterium]|nr:hypothetical protein [bacterium]